MNIQDFVQCCLEAEAHYKKHRECKNCPFYDTLCTIAFTQPCDLPAKLRASGVELP